MKTIFVLGGLLRKNRDGSYRTGKFNYIRVLAGYYLYKNLTKRDNVKFIVSGGRGIYEKIPGIPPVAQVMKGELIKLGLRPDEVTEENETASTYQELVWLKKFINKKNGKVIIISNAYHLPRVKAMIEYLSEFRKLKNILTLASAEKIVIRFNPKLKVQINKFNSSPKMKRVIASEKKGIKDLKRGKYKFR